MKNKLLGVALLWMFIALLAMVMPTEPVRSNDPVSFPVSRAVRDAIAITPDGPVSVSRAEAEDHYYALAEALKVATPPSTQREMDAQIVESLTLQVSDPSCRAALLRAASLIRNRQESPRQQR